MQQEESVWVYREELEDIAMEAVGYFFNLYLAQINKTNAENNVANNDTLYKISNGRYQLGKIGEK